jgi:hypothetical protein
VGEGYGEGRGGAGLNPDMAALGSPGSVCGPAIGLIAGLIAGLVKDGEGLVAGFVKDGEGALNIAFAFMALRQLQV